MAISSQKLLPQSRSTVISVRPSSSMVKSSSLSLRRSSTGSAFTSNASGGGGSLVSIYKTLINIDSVLNKRKIETEKQDEKIIKEKDKREKKVTEDKLELKPKKKNIDLPKIQTPFASFFDRLKNALVLLFVGWLVNRFFDYIPKILEGVSNFMKTLEDIRKFLKPATDALGSALYNVTLTGAKILGGLTGAQIDQNEKNLAVAINELDKKFSIVNALMAGIIIGDIFSAVADGLDLFERPGRTPSVDSRRVSNTAQQRYYQRFGRNAFIRKFGAEAIENLPRNMQRGFFQRGARNVGAMALRGARNAFGRGAVRVAGKVFGRIPVIGGLIDFVINLAMGEKPGRAAAKAVGATVGAGLGTLIPIPFAGTILGGFLGDLLGGAVYDMFASKPTGKKSPKKKTEKPKGYFLGGLVTRARNFIFGKQPSKPIVATRTTQKIVSSKSGSASSLQSFDVDSKFIDKIGETVIGGFVGVSNLLSSIPYVGPFAALGINLALTSKRLTKTGALGIAAGIGNLLGNPLSRAIINFFNKAMPGLGNLVQKVVGDDFGSFLSNWITEFLGSEMYKFLYPQLSLIKLIMDTSLKSAQEQSKKRNDSEEDGTPLGESETAEAKQLLDGLVSRGFTKEEAAAIVGNLYAESGFRTGATNPKSGAYGLMQWLGGRKSRLIQFAKDKGKQASDLQTQLDYIAWELKGGNAYETSQFQRAMAYGNTISAKTKGFAYEVERASADELSSSMRKRIGAAQSAYGQGGSAFSKINLPSLKKESANILPQKPQSISAMSYPGVSQFASYEKDKVQLVRQVIYMPISQNQQSSGKKMMPVAVGGVNNIDYQIAARAASL